MPVPNSFANVTTSIPLSQLDVNFNTPITLGNTAIQLGNTVTTLNNMTLANVTVSSGNVTITNVSVTTANVTTANIATAQIANVTVSGIGTFAAGSNTAPSITTSGDTNTGIFFPAADTIAFTEGGVESMRIDSAGNVGLGVTPSAWGSGLRALQVGANSYASVFDFNNGVSSYTSNLFYTGSAYARMSASSRWSMGYFQDTTNGAHTFVTSTAAGTNASTPTISTLATLDSSGNLGLGVTPSAWASSSQAFQNQAGSLFTVGNGSLRLFQNVYYNSGAQNVYVNTAAASGYIQTAGSHQWFYAPSGTAGAQATFTQAMTLDASGNLLVGTTTSFSPLTVNGSNRFDTVTFGDITTASNTCGIYLRSTGAAGISWAGGGYLAFFGGGVGSTERARIDSSGNLLVGETSQTWDERLSAKRTTNAVVGGFYSSATTYTSSVIRAQTEAAAGTGWILFEGRSATGVGRINIYGNGNIQNTNGSYGTLSDIKLKENIVDATPKLEQLQQIRIVNFNLIGDTQKQIGVIAQELEEVFPGLVEDIVDKDDEGNDLGTVTKSVKMSVFVPMLIKAIQEQQAMIDEMKAEIAALKGNA